MSMPSPADEAVQVFRRADGAFAFKPEAARLKADELLIGRGLTPAEAMELVEEFTAASLGRARG